MAGLRSFIHGSQPVAIPSPRKAPPKFVADESAYKGQRYASVEPSDEGSHQSHHAFSTDLGSYPDTSTNNTQDQFVAPVFEETVNGSVTNGSTQRHHHQQKPIDTTGHALSDDQDAITALLGPGDAQEFEDFVQNWPKHDNSLEEFLDFEILENQQHRVEPPKPANTQMLPPPRKVLPVQTVPNEQPKPPQMAKPMSGSNNPAVASKKPANLFQHRFRQQPKSQTENVYQRQDVTAATQGATKIDEIPGHQGISDVLCLSSNELPLKPAGGSELPSVSKAVIKSPIYECWPLKRKASLSSVKIHYSDRELLDLPYSSLDADEAEPEYKPLLSIDDMISSIMGNVYDEQDLLSRVSKLSIDNWIELGNQLSAAHGEAISQLKDFRSKKRDVSTQFENEIAKMMKQIEANSGLVEERLKDLRMSGAQMLKGGIGKK